MNTGENEQGLRQIIDFTRMSSLAMLGLHFYYYCYQAFASWHLTTSLSDRVLTNLERSGLFNYPLLSKAIAVLLLLISLVGAVGKKDEKARTSKLIAGVVGGLIILGSSGLILQLRLELQSKAFIYIGTTSIAFLLVLSFGTRLSRVIRHRLSGDIFNSDNETFPQQETIIANEYSINLPGRYYLRGVLRSSWINLINPFRGTLVIGSPGSGKTWFVIQHVIRQHIEKGFAMFIYDFKFDDLSKIAYNHLLKHEKSYSVKPSFYVINFDDLPRSHRCNPLDPSSMHDITDATESARTILLGLNKEWINKQGDFFVESPINFLTAVIWFLRKYEDGRYCTLPHVIELMQANYDQLFPALNSEPEIEVLVNPFISAYQNDAMEQLEGQVASAKIGMARLASPQLYWVLSGNDFTLDINNPDKPKIVCMGNNPEKQQIYGAVLSLFVSRMVRQVNKKGKLKCSLVFDEFPTIFFNHIDSLIATARSNRVATTLGMQDFSQLKKDYGRDQAEVIMNIAGNLIAGQVMGDTAKQLSERFGKILQDRESVSINRMDTSISRSQQLDYAIPASKIASLSSGQFVGMVADNPDQKMKLKMFHGEILNDLISVSNGMNNSIEIPKYSNVSTEIVLENFHQVKLDVRSLIIEQLQRLGHQSKKASNATDI